MSEKNLRNLETVCVEGIRNCAMGLVEDMNIKSITWVVFQTLMIETGY